MEHGEAGRALPAIRPRRPSMAEGYGREPLRTGDPPACRRTRPGPMCSSPTCRLGARRGSCPVKPRAISTGAPRGGPRCFGRPAGGHPVAVLRRPCSTELWAALTGDEGPRAQRCCAGSARRWRWFPTPDAGRSSSTSDNPAEPTRRLGLHERQAGGGLAGEGQEGRLAGRRGRSPGCRVRPMPEGLAGRGGRCRPRPGGASFQCRRTR